MHLQRWQAREEELIKRRYLTHSTQELVLALAAEGFLRSLSAVKRKLHAMGLIRNEDLPPFSYQVTEFCDVGDTFLPKVESDFRHYRTPYIVVRNDEGQQALFREALDDGAEPHEANWVRWYMHPTRGTWP